MIIDYCTVTKGFGGEVGDTGVYHWKKFKHFKKGNIILIRDSADGTDYIIRLTANPEEIPEGYENPYKNQKLMAKYKVIKRLPPDKSKLRVNAALRREIIKKYKNICQICHEEWPDEHLEVDHIRQYSAEGGLSIESNLVPLCKPDHKFKTQEAKRDEFKALIRAKDSPNVIGE